MMAGMTIEGKFKPGQEVMILNLLVNDNRMDVAGTVERYLYTGQPRTLKAEVLFNGVRLLLDETKLLTLQEYATKNLL